MTSSEDPLRPSSGESPSRPVGDGHSSGPAPASTESSRLDPASGSAEQPGSFSGSEPSGGEPPAVEPPAETDPVQESPVQTGGSKTAGLWISLILGAIVLVLLLIFVIQNKSTAHFAYFATTFDLPLGVAMLLAAIAGALVMALVGSVRMIQMSWTIRKLRKQQEKIHRVTR